MHKLAAIVVAFLLLGCTTAARADGLFYQLPDDGAWVQFETRITMRRGDQMREGTGQLRMASVGAATEGGKPCRWIEFNLTVKVGDQERVIVAKLLVPESQLASGKKPVENRVRGWIRMSAGNDVVELTETNLGPIPAFLANPLTDVKQLEAEVVECPLGKLSCEGLSGRTEFLEGNSTNKITYQTRRHAKAPFGVVSSRMKIDVERDGAVAESVEMTLKVSDTGQGAKSELPDDN